MKDTYIKVIMALTMILFAQCKKDYVCECSNPGGVFKTYTMHDTKKKAKATCDDYTKENQNVLFSETGCVLK